MINNLFLLIKSRNWHLKMIKDRPYWVFYAMHTCFSKSSKLPKIILSSGSSARSIKNILLSHNRSSECFLGIKPFTFRSQKSNLTGCCKPKIFTSWTSVKNDLRIYDIIWSNQSLPSKCFYDTDPLKWSINPVCQVLQSQNRSMHQVF